MIGTASDITERKVIESKLRMLSVAVEQSPASVVITDLQSRIEYINPAFIEATGFSSVEAIGQTPNLISSGETPKEIYKQLWGNLTRGLKWKGELQNKRKNGEHFWEETHIAPVKDAVGNPTNYVAVKIDVTDRKRLESEVRQLAF
jgi:PAS domain S-box-containing protein